MCVEFQLQNLYGRDHLRDIGMCGRIVLKWDLNRI
jgi:hypothetical protein